MSYKTDKGVTMVNRRIRLKVAGMLIYAAMIAIGIVGMIDAIDAAWYLARK